MPYFPQWEVGLEMLTSAHGALRHQVYCQVSDSHEVFISSSFGVNLERSRARSRHGTEVSMHAQLTWPRWFAHMAWLCPGADPKAQCRWWHRGLHCWRRSQFRSVWLNKDQAPKSLRGFWSFQPGFDSVLELDPLSRCLSVTSDHSHPIQSVRVILYPIPVFLQLLWGTF